MNFHRPKPQTSRIRQSRFPNFLHDISFILLWNELLTTHSFCWWMFIMKVILEECLDSVYFLNFLVEFPAFNSLYLTSLVIHFVHFLHSFHHKSISLSYSSSLYHPSLFCHPSSDRYHQFWHASISIGQDFLSSLVAFWSCPNSSKSPFSKWIQVKPRRFHQKFSDHHQNNKIWGQSYPVKHHQSPSKRSWSSNIDAWSTLVNSN